MNRREDQSGPSAVVVLIILAVVAVLAVVGLVVYQHYQNTSTKNTASTNATSTTTQPQSTTSTQPAQTATKYLTIKEWGVRASYTGGDTFTYTLSSDGKFADVDSKQLVSKDSACAKGGSGGIARFSPADYVHQDQHGPTVEQDAAQNPNLYKHIGGYYYRFAHAQALCSGTVSANDQSQANDAVSVLVSNLQAISN